MNNKSIKKMENKKAQVAVFVILALMIIIILIFLFVGKDRIKEMASGKTPVEQIRDCAREYTEEVVDKLSVQGGSLNPENYYLYQGNKIEYLCYTEEYYQRCVMQKPLLKQSIEKEITDYISPKIKECMNSVKQNLEKKGYSVKLNKINIQVDLIPKSILIDIQSDLAITKDKTEIYKSIKTDVSSELYNLVMVALNILNWEARYGDSETMNYMLYYPSLKVEKKKQSDGTTIYILTDRVSLDRFMFASRSMALPAGLTG